MENEDIITLRSPDGSLGTAKRSEAKYLLREGYSVPSDADIQKHNDLIDAGSGINPLIAGAEAAGSAATFGLSRELENKLGVTTPEAQALRKEANPIASGIGTGVGVVAPLLLTAGASAPAQVAGRAAVGAAEAANVGRAALGAADILNPVGAAMKIGTGVTEATAPALGKIGASALGGATEGALYGVGQSIDEHALGDPDALGEHLVSNVGINSLLGGAVGGLFGAASKALSKEPQKFVSELDRPLIENGDFAASVRNSDIPDKEGIFASLKRLKPDAGKTKEIGNEYGLPVLEGYISDSKAVRHAEDVLLSGQPTYTSINRQEIAKAGFDKAAKIVEDTVKVGDDLSALNAGDKMKAILDANLEKEYAPSKELYKLVKEKSPFIPIEEASLKNAANEIKEIPEFKRAQRYAPGFVKGIIEDLENGSIKTVDDLMINRDALNKSIQKMPSHGEKYFAGEINTILKELEHNSIVSHASSLEGAAKDPSIMGLIDKVHAARSEYKGFITKYKELAKGLGRKNVEGPQAIADFIDGINPQQIAGKVFTDKNVEFTQFMQKNFPEVFEIARKYKIGELKEAASKKGYFDVKQFTKNLNALEPETQRMLFNEADRKVIDDMDHYFRQMPESFNPSKTAYASAYMNAFSDGTKSLFLANARDFALEKFIKGAAKGSYETGERTGIMAKIAETAKKTQNVIETSAKSVFSDKGSAAAIGVGSLLGADDKENQKILEKVQKLNEDPEEFSSLLEKSTEGIFPHAPGTAAGVNKSIVNAVRILNQNAPKPSKRGVLSPSYKPPKSQVYKFNRTLRTIQKPASVMRGIKFGAVSSDDVMILKEVYPQMLQQMRMAVMESMADQMARGKEIPYQTKIGLSQFLEMNLMDSMDPKSIAMNQISPSGDSQKEDEKVKPTATGMNKLAANERISTNLQDISNGDEA